MRIAVADQLGGEDLTHALEETNMTEPTTYTLDVPGAVLTYDILRNDQGTGPVLLLIGSPMRAAGFGDPGRAPRRPQDRHLRPARRGAQPTDGWRQRVHAG